MTSETVSSAQAACAMVLLRVMNGAVTGTRECVPNSTEVESWVTAVNRQRSTLPPEIVEWIHGAPQAVQALAHDWKRMTAGERDSLLQGWGQDLHYLYSKLGRLLVDAIPDLSRSDLNVYDESRKVTGVAGGISSYIDDQREQIDKARQVDPLLAAQLRAQYDKENIEWSGRMSQIIHDMHMGIIRNITY